MIENLIGRKQVTVRYKSLEITSKQYAKALYEAYHNVRLGYDDTIDHIDNDKTNDDITNLQILTRADNSRKAMPIPYDVEVKCHQCGEDFIIKSNRLRDRKLWENKRNSFLQSFLFSEHMVKKCKN